MTAVPMPDLAFHDARVLSASEVREQFDAWTEAPIRPQQPDNPFRQPFNVSDWKFEESIAARNGTVVFRAEEGSMACTARTYTAVLAGHGHDRIEEEFRGGADDVKVKLVDVGPLPRDARKPVQPPQDQIDEVCARVGALVAQLSQFASSESGPTDAQLGQLATRYGELRDRVAYLRRVFAEAEGRFEMAQELIIALLADQ